MEKQTGQKIKYLQSDNGREYYNRSFNSFLRNEDIRRRLSVPYTPEQNGIAERKNRTLTEMAQCMFIQAHLSHGFWTEAVSTANYIRNRCTTKRLEEKSPFEMWYGRRPDISHLRFGKKAHVLNKDPRKIKLDPRTKMGTFIGYAEESKTYRMWMPEERRVVVSRDVKVLESEFGEDLNNNNDFNESSQEDKQSSEMIIWNTHKKMSIEEPEERER